MTGNPEDFVVLHVSMVFETLSKAQLLEIKNYILTGTEISDSNAKRAFDLLSTSNTSPHGLHEVTKQAILRVIRTRCTITQEELHEGLSSLEDSNLTGIYLHLFAFKSKRQNVPFSDKIAFLYENKDSEYLSLETANAFNLYCKNRLNI